MHVTCMGPSTISLSLCQIMDMNASMVGNDVSATIHKNLLPQLSSTFSDLHLSPLNHHYRVPSLEEAIIIACTYVLPPSSISPEPVSRRMPRRGSPKGSIMSVLDGINGVEDADMTCMFLLS